MRLWSAQPSVSTAQYCGFLDQFGGTCQNRELAPRDRWIEVGERGTAAPAPAKAQWVGRGSRRKGFRIILTTHCFCQTGGPQPPEPASSPAKAPRLLPLRGGVGAGPSPGPPRLAAKVGARRGASAGGVGDRGAGRRGLRARGEPEAAQRWDAAR